MANEIQSNQSTELTPQEAEAVLELWARRQAEGELRSRLNVDDLAEATGLSPAEIEKMVRTLRSGNLKPHSAPITMPAKPVNRLLIASVVAVWFLLLGAVGYFAYDQGRASRMARPMVFGEAPFPDFEAREIMGVPAPIEGIAPAAILAPVQTATELVRALPSDLRLEFNGFVVQGQNQTVNRTEEEIAQLVSDLVSLYSPAVISEATELSTAQIENALATNGKDSDLVRYLNISMYTERGGQQQQAKIPVVRKANPTLRDAVDRVSLEEIRRLVNRIQDRRNKS